MVSSTRLMVEAQIASKWPALSIALNHHRNTSNKPMDLARRLYQVAILKDDSQRLVIMKSVQVGVSEILIIKAISKLYQGWAIIYSLPIESLRNTFVSNRIDKVLQQVPFYRDGIKNAMGQSDQVGMKHFGQGVIKFVGSGSESAFLEFPADLVIIDEKDKSDLDNLKMAPDRLDASEHKGFWEVGNPSHSKFGIHESYIESDQKRWNIKCLACNEWQDLNFFKNVVKQSGENEYELIDKKRSLNDPGDIQVYCNTCLSSIDRLMPGQWIARYPERSISGYHISQLFSYTKTIRELWEMFVAGQTDSTLMQVFYNSRLGLPYDAAGDNLTAALLESKCKDDYLMPSTANDCTMGMDVGGKLHIRISDYPETGKRRAVYIGAVHSFDEAANLIKKYNVKFCVVDAKPEIHKVREFQAKFPRKVYLCDYATNEKIDFWDVNPKEYTIRADRTASIDGMVSGILNGQNRLPKNFRTIDGTDYIDQMEAPTRIYDEKGKRYKWDEKGNADHYFHAENYDNLAMKIKKDIGDRMPRLTVVTA